MKMACVGLSHSCCTTPGASLDNAFGPVRLRTLVKSATGRVESSGWRAVPVMTKFASRLLVARLSGSYRNNPFFTPAGLPVVQPRVLSLEERSALY